LLGLDLGAARAAGAISFSILIGLLMAAIFRSSEAKLNARRGDLVMPQDEHHHPLLQVATYFALMVALLVFASSIGLVVEIHPEDVGKAAVIFSGRWIPALIASLLLVAVVVVSVLWYSGEEVADWMRETGKLAWKILPILLIGVFIAGIIKSLLPEETVRAWVGGNSFGNNLLASVFGALMYFSTLTEVPIVKALMDLGMGRGPALTLLLAGPSLSLPNMIVISRVMGVKRTAVYVILVIVLSTFGGMLFGSL